jgi:hypothetical protein
MTLLTRPKKTTRKDKLEEYERDFMSVKVTQLPLAILLVLVDPAGQKPNTLNPDLVK